MDICFEMEEEYEEEAYGGDIPGEVELLGHHDDEYEEVELGDEEEGEGAATDADNTQAGGHANTAAKVSIMTLAICLDFSLFNFFKFKFLEPGEMFCELDLWGKLELEGEV